METEAIVPRLPQEDDMPPVYSGVCEESQEVSYDLLHLPPGFKTLF